MQSWCDVKKKIYSPREIPRFYFYFHTFCIFILWSHVTRRHHRITFFNKKIIKNKLLQKNQGGVTRISYVHELRASYKFQEINESINELISMKNYLKRSLIFH